MYATPLELVDKQGIAARGPRRVEKIAFNSDYLSILRKHVSCCAHESDLWWNEVPMRCIQCTLHCCSSQSQRQA
jgi:hypothetical protein